jgi:hypothetical protein
MTKWGVANSRRITPIARPAVSRKISRKAHAREAYSTRKKRLRSIRMAYSNTSRQRAPEAH